MSISTSSGENGQLIINIQGRFDFSVHQNFRAAYEKPKDVPNSFLINMSDTSYLDSSALGMLLLLRDYAGGDSSDVTISNASENVRKILSISNFEQLFKIT